jgi:thiol:disulfide interchange protein DsbC
MSDFKPAMSRLLLAFLLLAPLLAWADAAADTAIVKQKLAELIPNRTPTSIEASAVPGIYQVAYGVQLFYVSADGKYLFDGELIDTQSRVSLSVEKQSQIRKAMMAGLNAKDMIVFPAKGETKHIITVFTDIDCPYCQKLHNEVPQYNELGVEVRYMLFPRSGVGSPSYNKAVSAWCAEDKGKALTDAKNGVDIKPLKCDNPVAKQYEIGQQLGVTGTPAVLLDGGELLPGYRPAPEVAKMLDHLKSTRKGG